MKNKRTQDFFFQVKKTQDIAIGTEPLKTKIIQQDNDYNSKRQKF